MNNTTVAIATASTLHDEGTGSIPGMAHKVHYLFDGLDCLLKKL